MLEPSELALIQNIKESVAALRTEADTRFWKVDTALFNLHTGANCKALAEVKQDLRDFKEQTIKDIKSLNDQQKIWIGGMAVLLGIGGLIVGFKDLIIGLFKK